MDKSSEISLPKKEKIIHCLSKSISNELGMQLMLLLHCRIFS